MLFSLKKLVHKLHDTIFRSSEIMRFMELSGQKKLSKFYQIKFGFKMAAPYIFIGGVVCTISIALHLYPQPQPQPQPESKLALPVGGGLISLLGFAYGVLVSPSEMGAVKVSDFVNRTHKNKNSIQTIVSQLPSVIMSINQQISTLNSIYRVTCLIFLLFGIMISLFGLMDWSSKCLDESSVQLILRCV